MLHRDYTRGENVYENVVVYDAVLMVVKTSCDAAMTFIGGVNIYDDWELRGYGPYEYNEWHSGGSVEHLAFSFQSDRNLQTVDVTPYIFRQGGASRTLKIWVNPLLDGYTASTSTKSLRVGG